MTRIGRIFTDNPIRVNPRHPHNPVHPVQTVSSHSAAPDSHKILDFMNARSSAAPEDSDIFHDLLAHLAGFDALASTLAKNKKKLKDGYDPTRRELKEKSQAEFNTSIGKLAPLMKRIQATDKLIDQIVYKLYGLTSDEIKIVEESISGGQNAKETGITG